MKAKNCRIIRKYIAFNIAAIPFVPIVEVKVYATILKVAGSRPDERNCF
jgi:hypothetical protein